jgi:hypothetical protein
VDPFIRNCLPHLTGNRILLPARGCSQRGLR